MATGPSRLNLKVVPGAREDRVDGWPGDALKLRVSAPPERGKANQAVVRLIAETLGIPRADVEIVSGRSSPRKVIEVVSLSPSELRDRLGKPTDGGG